MLVTIPSRTQHEGMYSMTIELADACPVCGGPRGEAQTGISYDGSLRLSVATWRNPCGHVDKYDALRQEFTESLRSNPALQVQSAPVSGSYFTFLCNWLISRYAYADLLGGGAAKLKAELENLIGAVIPPDAPTWNVRVEPDPEVAQQYIIAITENDAQ